MIRTVSLIVLTCGVAFAAPRPETTTYVDGNVSSLKPNTGGTLVFTDDQTMTFRNGLTNVAVPYSDILHAQLSAPQTHSEDAPLYKVWELPKRLHKTEAQLLTVEFKNGSGESRTMTLELARPAASEVMAAIQSKTQGQQVAEAEPPAAKAPAAAPQAAVADSGDELKVRAKSRDDWWGDDYWKTNRNVAKWDAEAKGSN